MSVFDILRVKNELRVLEVVRRVTRLYNYNESDDIDSEMKVFCIDNNILRIYNYPNTYKTLEIINLALAILKSFQITEYKLSSDDLDLNVLLEQFDLQYKDQALRLEFNNRVFLTEASNYIQMDLNCIVSEVMEKKRTIVKPDNLVVYIMSDDATMIEALKVLNVLRLGGIKAEIDYDNLSLEDQYQLAIDSNCKYICLIDDEDLTKINIMDTKDNSEETINTFEVYPYIINKINKQALGACASCKDKE